MTGLPKFFPVMFATVEFAILLVVPVNQMVTTLRTPENIIETQIKKETVVEKKL